MTTPFIENESYMHKMAKEVLKKWFEETKTDDGSMCIGGIGKDQLKSNILGLQYIDGIRIGLEDNLYYKDKEKTTNIDLLKRIHRIMEEMDIITTSPKSFKELGYGNKKINNTR